MLAKCLTLGHPVLQTHMCGRSSRSHATFTKTARIGRPPGSRGVATTVAAANGCDDHSCSVRAEAMVGDCGAHRKGACQATGRRCHMASAWPCHSFASGSRGPLTTRLASFFTSHDTLGRQAWLGALARAGIWTPCGSTSSGSQRWTTRPQLNRSLGSFLYSFTRILPDLFGREGRRRRARRLRDG